MKVAELKPQGTGKSAQHDQQPAGKVDPKPILGTPDVSEPPKLPLKDWRFSPPTLPLGDEWLSPQTVATGIETCVPTVLRAYRRGDLIGFKLTPRLVRFRRSDVLSWLNRSRIGAPDTTQQEASV